MSYEVIGDETLAAVVNPTRMKIDTNVDINGVFHHVFMPGVLEGRLACIKFCSEERATLMQKTRPQALRKFKANTARILLDKARKSGDFFAVWDEMFGPTPSQDDFVRAKAAEERATLIKRLQAGGLHDVLNLSIADLKRYAADPASYWDDKVMDSVREDEAGEPVAIVEIPADTEEPGIAGLNALRKTLREAGVRVPPRAGRAWMNEAMSKLPVSEGAAVE